MKIRQSVILMKRKKSKFIYFKYRPYIYIYIHIFIYSSQIDEYKLNLNNFRNSSEKIKTVS